MPYKSQAQRRLFHHLAKQGKLSPEVVEEYDRESKGKKMPEYVKRKAFGGEVEAKAGVHCPACDLPLDSAPVALDAGEGCPRCGYGDAKDVPHKAHGGMIHGYAEGGEVEADEEPMSPKQQKVRAHIGELMKAVGEGLRAGEQPKRRPRPFDSVPRQGSEIMEPTTYRARGGEMYVPLKARGGMIGNMKELYPEERGSFAKALRRRR